MKASKAQVELLQRAKDIAWLHVRKEDGAVFADSPMQEKMPEDREVFDRCVDDHLLFRCAVPDRDHVFYGLSGWGERLVK